MKAIGLLSFVVALTTAFSPGIPDRTTVAQTFAAWKKEFSKTYSSLEEEAIRFKIFLENDLKIRESNANGLSYTLGHNKFSDLTAEEFKIRIHGHTGKCYNGLEDPTADFPVVNPGMYMAPEDLPDSVDWTTANPPVVNPIKDQGNCGSCWAFSAAGCTESQYAINKGTLNSLSEQELVDCSNGLDGGCQGGFMDNAFMYISDNNGLALESEYEYTARNGKCTASDYQHYDPIHEFVVVERDNSTALASAVVLGPVSIGIEADQTAFQFYQSGVLTGNCGTSIDHGVIVVGYGHDDSSGYDYWKVRNSWGTSWGEEGYVRICRNCNKNGDKGECCILCQPSYARVLSTDNTKKIE